MWCGDAADLFGNDFLERVDLFGGGGLIFGDVALLGHEVEDVVLADYETWTVVAARASAVGRIIIWALRNAGEQRSFIEGEVLGVFVEVGVGGRFDAVGGGAVGNLVQVHLENLIFGVGAFDLEGENEFFYFTQKRTFVGENGVFDELLGECRGARDALTFERVDDDGTEETAPIDAVMFVEAAIFDGDRGLLHVERNFIDAYEGAFFVAVDFVEEVGAGAIVDFGGLSDVATAEAVWVGKIATYPGGKDGEG